MSWTVILEDENKVEVASLNNEFVINSFNEIVNNENFKLIRYLDPYGDAVFNHLQMQDLISDLENLTKIDRNNQLVVEIISLAKRCIEESHLYLVFYGD